MKKNKYSNIFNNSKKVIESSSLNLNSHFDEQFSNKLKKSRNNQNNTNNETINANAYTANTSYSSYIKYNGKSKTINELNLYRKKADLSLRRENERKKLEWF